MRSKAFGLAGILGAGTALVFSAVQADQGLEIVNQEILSDRDRPEVCVVADRSFSDDRTITWTDYLRVTPTPPGLTARSHDRRLCAIGLDHGETYEIVLRDGAPATDGSRLARSVSLEAYIPDRPPSARFEPSGHILPLGLGQGIPLTTINTAQAELRLMRIDPRNIPSVSDRWMQYGDLSRWASENIAEADGELIWTGRVTTDDTTANRASTTIVPVQDILPEMDPGLYVITAAADGDDDRSWTPLATQWFVATDTGLSTLTSDAGLHVTATSLTTNEPLADIDLTLVARNNRVLGTARTDDDGLAVFAPGTVRGTGGAAPGMLHAKRGFDDFSYLNLERAGHDLVERGGDGRSTPGAMDGYAFTERGLYRPGETINLSILLRNPQGQALTGVPLTVTTINPVRNAFDDRVVTDSNGGYATAIELPLTAPTGAWTLRVTVGDDGPTVAETSVFVSDFVPPQIEVDVAAERIQGPDGSSAIEATVESAFFFGAPAADLSGDIQVMVRGAETPFADLSEYRFALAQEPFLTEREEPTGFVLDAEGRATSTVFLRQRPGANQPLEAVVNATVNEPGGRPATARTTVALLDRPAYLGLKSDREAPWGIDDRAGFTAIAVDAAGNPLPDTEVTYDLYRENYQYVWYREYGSWYAEELVTDTRIAGDTLTTGADGTIRIEEDLFWGRYRIEVHAPEIDATEASIRFAAGYWGAGDERETADNVTISIDREHYRPGDVAQVNIETPYPQADLLVAVADRSVRSLQRLSAEDGTARLEIPVDDTWENGAYVLVTAIAPPDAVAGPLPRRAVGLRWIGMDPTPSTLDIALDAPELALPQSDVEITASVTSADDPSATLPPGTRVQLAAVDEAVLGMTDHPAPDPVHHFFGQRRTTVEMRDLFGSLIDPTGDRVGVLSTGGDWALSDPEGLPDPSIEIASWVSDILTVDEQGRVTASLPVPDFNGRLRLTAVAWNDTATGAARSDLTVRAPVVTDLILPRFMAVGDRATATLRLQNLDGPAGSYDVILASDGAVSTRGDATWSLDLDAGGTWTQTVNLAADAIGNGDLSVALAGPEDLALTRNRTLGVRSPHPPASESLVSTIPPNGGLTLTPDILHGFLPDTARVTQVIGAGPTIDIPALAERLVDYPYACVEQSISRAFPLLALADGPFAPALAGLQTPRQAVQQSVFRIAAQQSPSGAFALWGRGGPESLWLTAYATEFLLAAADHDYTVPTAPLRASLSWLDNATRNISGEPNLLDAQLYALYVLTRAGRNTMADLRYIYETRLDRLPLGVGLAALAAGLAEQGDATRATATVDYMAAMGRAGISARDTEEPRRDYGSVLRDTAALVTLATASVHIPDDTLRDLWADVTVRLGDTSYPNTQELAWSLRAAGAAMTAQGPLNLRIGPETIADRVMPVAGPLDIAALRDGIRIENLGDAPVEQTLTIRGLPKAAPPATDSNAMIFRDFYHLDGRPADPDGLTQGDRLIMVLTGSLPTQTRRDLVIEQWLPAGWEAEDLRLTGETIQATYPWIGDVVPTDRVEVRDDRVIAAPTPEAVGSSFRVAFLLRVVTPGTYTLPGAYLEDMYDPRTHARLAATTINVQAP